MKQRLRIEAIVAGLLLVASFGAVAADKIVLGTGVDPSYGEVYVAKDGGFFAKNGLDVEVKLFSSGSAAATALIPGDIQVAMTSVPAGALHHALSSKVVLVALTNILAGYNGAAAQADVKQLTDLRGRKVGVAKGTSSENSSAQALQRVGMSMADVKVVYVEPPEMLAALLRKDIDAFFIWEPWITKAKFAGGDSVNLLKGVEFYIVETHMVMDKEWASKNLNVAARYVKAIREAGDFIRAKPAESAKIIAQFLKLEERLVAELLPKQKFMTVLDDGAMEYLKKDVDALVAAGKIKAPFDYAGYIYPDVLRALDPKLVTYTQLPK